MNFISVGYLRWRGCIVLSIALCSYWLLPGCKPSPVEQEATEEVIPDTLPGDFVIFFDRFHTDSAYQMEHIIFPLEGMPDSKDGVDTLQGKRFYWQKENWVRHYPMVNPHQQFDHWFEVLNPRIIEHWIHTKGTNLYLHRRFAHLDNEWFLIYYAGMRPLSQPPASAGEGQ